MSRCFPYPPPGYVRGEISLAESIKLQELKEQEKQRKKEKKREHKQKNDKKKRSRETYEQTTEEKQIQTKRQIDKENEMGSKVKILPGDKVQCLPHQKVQFLPEEQLEKSGLTEELEQPHQQYQCGSPDSCVSEDSSKRRRIVDDVKNSNGSPAAGLRIRFALGNLKVPEVVPESPVNILRLPVRAPAAIKSSLFAPTSDAVAVVGKEPEVVPTFISEEDEAPESSGRPLSSRMAETSTSQQPTTSAELSSFLDGYRGGKKSRKGEAKFNELFLNWTPPPLSEPGSPVDEDWLFKFNTSRPQPRQVQHDTGTGLGQGTAGGQLSPASSLCSWPPRACHLEDADVYALPFVVPF